MLAHEHKLAVVDISQVLKVLDAPVVPLHEKDARHEAVGDKHADTGKVLLTKAAPESLVEARDTVIGVCCTLSVGDTVEEMAIICTLLPHALHLGRAWLKVAKVLLT